MNLKPLNDHVFIEPTEEEKVTKSGIVLPDTADKEKPIQGTVVAVGPGKLDKDGKRVPMSVCLLLFFNASRACSLKRISFDIINKTRLFYNGEYICFLPD